MLYSPLSRISLITLRHCPQPIGAVNAARLCAILRPSFSWRMARRGTCLCLCVQSVTRNKDATERLIGALGGPHGGFDRLHLLQRSLHGKKLFPNPFQSVGQFADCLWRNACVIHGSTNILLSAEKCGTLSHALLFVGGDVAKFYPHEWAKVRQGRTDKAIKAAW